jgi:hypothetical protein
MMSDADQIDDALSAASSHIPSLTDVMTSTDSAPTKKNYATPKDILGKRKQTENNQYTSKSHKNKSTTHHNR